MKRLFVAVAVIAASFMTGPVSAQTAASSAQPTTEGEVRKVDKSAKKLTIKHAEIKSLDMPPMTMVFQVKDVTVLDKLSVGDKVLFTAERVGGAFTVTAIELVR